MPRYARVEGVAIEPLGHLWASYSPVTGETSLLNDESAAILEILEQGEADAEDICRQLSMDSGVSANDLAEVLQDSWPTLVDAGLVRLVGSAHRVDC